MDIIGKFKNGTITISNIKTEDDEYKCHFQFDINISTPLINYNYHFGESVYFSMFNFLILKQIKLVDENNINNYLEMTNDYFLVSINQDGYSSNLKILFDGSEDFEILTDFLIEFKAVCETLLER